MSTAIELEQAYAAARQRAVLTQGLTLGQPTVYMYDPETGVGISATGHTPEMIESLFRDAWMRDQTMRAVGKY